MPPLPQQTLCYAVEHPRCGFGCMQELDRVAEAHGLTCLGAEPDVTQVPQQKAPTADTQGAGLGVPTVF